MIGPDDPRLAPYRIVRDPELVRRSDRFLAEGRLVVSELLRQAQWPVESVVVTANARAALAVDLAARPDVPVLELTAETLTALGKIQFHQGCLALGRRPAPVPPAEHVATWSSGSYGLGLEQVSNPDNVGAIFRSARALGASGIVLSARCASPLYRKALRSSMGAALRLPFAHDARTAPDCWQALRAPDLERVALTTGKGAQPLEAWVRTRDPGRRAMLLLGAEGEGLCDATLAGAETHVTIPMVAGHDSLNVAASAAIALYALRGARG